MLNTKRLQLRRWHSDDRKLFAEINADPRVMEFFPALLTRAESDALIDRIERHFDQHGFGLWALEVTGGAPLIGFTGLAIPGFEAGFTPCVEIGWRLAADHWGRGYATEAAQAVLAAAFGQFGLPEVVSFTAVENHRSRRVMERIGMRRDPSEDFDHPALQPDDPLRRHVLYRIQRDA